MKLCTHIATLILLLMLFQCASSSKLQKETPETFKNAYFQKWNAGIKGSGSGVTIYIEMKDNALVLDSVYFRGKATKLHTKPQNQNVFIGRFKYQYKASDDIIMSSDPNAEVNNKIKINKPNIPFELKSNECVISYRKGNNTKYFKVSNLIEKEVINYPSTPPNEH